MNVYIVIASINELSNIVQFKSQLAGSDHEIKVVVVDEGNKRLRMRNSKLLQGLTHEFYGPKERAMWFRARFNGRYNKYLRVIPDKCHAETSFGFLVAYEEHADLIIELDDDVFPADSRSIVDAHWKNLTEKSGVSVMSYGKWYNTLDNLKLSTRAKLYPRGHPYASEARLDEYLWTNEGEKCVLNMGLWAGCPDLDALTLLSHGGLNGLCSIESRAVKKEKVIVKKGTYFALCSMNASFTAEIVPAFYQFYMKYMGVDRFDDIWSGIFLKKVADHLEDRICLGAPLIFHNKRPRNVFKDLKSELHGMEIHERLWRLIDDMPLDGKAYWDVYSSLIERLKSNVAKWFDDAVHLKFLKTQIEKMQMWCEITDKLK